MEAPGKPKGAGKPSVSGAFAQYPAVGFHFEVRIVERAATSANGGGASKDTKGGDARFLEVSGISAEIPTEDYTEGGEHRFVYRLPNSVKYAPLILKRGLISSLSPLNTWVQGILKSGLQEKISTKDLVINLLNEENAPLMGWTFINAYPTKWQVSNFNAMNNEVAIETLEISYQRFEAIKV